MSKAGSRHAGTTRTGFSAARAGRTLGTASHGRVTPTAGVAATFMNERGVINIDRVAEAFHMSRS